MLNEYIRPKFNPNLIVHQKITSVDWVMEVFSQLTFYQLPLTDTHTRDSTKQRLNKRWTWNKIHIECKKGRSVEEFVETFLGRHYFDPFFLKKKKKRKVTQRYYFITVNFLCIYIRARKRGREKRNDFSNLISNSYSP